jgi:hypothetical protein
MFARRCEVNEITLDELYEAVGEGLIEPREFLAFFTFWLSDQKLLPAGRE